MPSHNPAIFFQPLPDGGKSLFERAPELVPKRDEDGFWKLGIHPEYSDNMAWIHECDDPCCQANNPPEVIHLCEASWAIRASLCDVAREIYWSQKFCRCSNEGDVECEICCMVKDLLLAPDDESLLQAALQLHAAMGGTDA